MYNKFINLMNLLTTQNLSMGLEQRPKTYYALLNIQFISYIDQSDYHNTLIFLLLQ